MTEQTLRSRMLLGDEAVERLGRCHVAVFGLGGVGSWCAEALARTGVGELTLVDDDRFSESNLNRQAGALHSTVGKLKTEVMGQRLLDINPDLRLHLLSQRYLPENRESFFQLRYDYLADAIDSVTSKIDLIETAVRRQIPLISSMGTGNQLDAMQLHVTDLSKTSGCPLARVMRRELRKREIVHLDVVCSKAPPVQQRPAQGMDEGRSVPGSVMWVPAAAGMLMAQEIVMHLIEEPAGSL